MLRYGRDLIVGGFGLLGLHVAFMVAPWWVGVPAVGLSVVGAWSLLNARPSAPWPSRLYRMAGPMILFLWCSLGFVGLMTGYLDGF